MNFAFNITSILSVIILCKIFDTEADILTDFDDKKDGKYTLFGFENQISPEKFHHWNYEGKVSANPVAFEPPSLDFPDTPIGQPKWEHVKIINEDESSTLKLLSISSSTVDFHCSFFKEEVIMEGGNSSFDIVFLSRQLGAIQSTLFIQTSKGTFQYKVAATGIPSPHRLKSFHRTRIPLNSSFSSPIHFYNPFNYPIQILEMYTSGGDAHLELPSNGKHASKKLWTVPPYETRTLMKVRFLGRKVGNFTSFIRIRTNTTDNTLGFVIPLQIEISNKSSLYCINDILHFGILRTLDSPKVLKVLVVNSAKESIRIKSVSLTKPNDAITIDFHQINVPPGIYQQTSAATITFSAFKATSESNFAGNVIVETFQNQTLTIPFSADIIHGSLVYDANNTKFFIGSGELKTEIRSIAITNTFEFTIAIYSISVPAKSNFCFKILNVTLPIFIKNQMTERSIEIQFNVQEKISPFITQMAIFSNASLFVIPLFVYDGKLTIISHRPEMYKGYLDFGTLGLSIEDSLHFTIKNENPVEIILFSMSTNWYFATVFLIGVEKGNNTLLQKNSSHQPMNNFVPLILKPYHFAVFRLIIQTPDSKGVFASEISIVTSYEKISIPYYLRTTDGVISNVNSLSLKNCFPSKISKLVLTLNSSFQSYIELTAVKFIPNDTRFDFDPKLGRKLPILINPTESTNVGYMKFSPDNDCIDPLSNEFIDVEKSKSTVTQSQSIQFRIFTAINGKVPCYVGFNVCTKFGYLWLNSFEMNSNTYDIDNFIYKRLNQQWEILKLLDNHMFNMTMQMDTSTIKGFLYNVQVQFIWPSLLTTSKFIKFPLTQIGNCSFKDIYLENPSDKFVLVQLILIEQYTDPYSLLELLGISERDIDISKFGVFALHPKKTINDRYIYIESMKESNKIKNMFSFFPHNESMMVYLSPKNKQKIRIYFNPTQDQFGSKISTFILLRNNLTGIEVLRLEGEGTYGELSFQGGQFPEETSQLNFDLTEKHLKSCDSQSKGLLPSFTVRRPFAIKNIGKIPVYILGFQFGHVLNLHENQKVLESPINDSYSPTLPIVLDIVKSDVENSGESMWCSGYGFEILECYEHRLEVNETLKLEIVFTPDFSLHKVIQQLQIHTSLSEIPFNITVHATLPAHMLHRCSQALARPDSEVLIWYMGMVVLSVVSVVSIIMSYYEADRIFTSNVIYRHLSSVAVGSYTHSSNDKICDFRTLVSKNSPFIGTSGQLHSHKSSVQDYLSTHSRCSGEANTVKRVNLCKKYDDKPLSNLTEKQFSQSFCGRSISDDVTYSDGNVNSIMANTIHQHKKKKKRGIIGSLIQWFLRSFNLIANQNSALKPKLDNSYKLNYKNEVPSIIKSSMLSHKLEDTKNDLSNKNIIFNSKMKLSCNVQESTLTNILPHSSISNNNNSNHPNHSKKLRNRHSYIIGVNSNKVINKQNDQTVATLNFAPIDIPALDAHKCRKNQMNKKLKKGASITIEEIKTKSLSRMDDSISISTDSSTDEKVKELEGTKCRKTSVSKCCKLKQELKVQIGNSMEDCTENRLKMNVCSELDDECSNKSNDSGIESTKKNNIKQSKDKFENSYQECLRHSLKPMEQNSTKTPGNDICKKEIKHETRESKKNYHGKLPTYKDQKSYVCDRDVMFQEDNVASEINDFSVLSEKTELFSNTMEFNDGNSVDMACDVENWMSTKSKPCIPPGNYDLINDESNTNYPKSYIQLYCGDMNFQNERACQGHGCLEDGSLSQLPIFHTFYKSGASSMVNSENIRNNSLLHQKLCRDDIYNHDMSTFMSLELPGIAHGRKLSLLEYERRLQREMTESERTLTLKEYDNIRSISNSVDQYWDMNQHGDSSNDPIWNPNEVFQKQRNNIIDNSLWPSEKCWNHVEPGSQHDILARTLLPVGLLSNENSNGMFRPSPDNLWKFKPDDISIKQSNNCEMDSVEN